MKTIAFVIGVSDYKSPSFCALPGADADANRFAASLKSWGLPPEWIMHIHHKQATKAEIIKTFYHMRSEFDVPAKFIFYFAGHGARASEESSLILHDTEAEDILGTGLRLVELMQLIRTLKPEQSFLFIDACHLRLNSLINPLNDLDIFSTTNSKGLFCMFSSGVLASYEDTKQKGGYFTSALIKAIGELKLTKQPTCHDILKKVENSMLLQEMPTPEAYHVGSAHIWPLESSYSIDTLQNCQRNPALIERWEAIATLKDSLSKTKDPLIWMWGEAGLGKTVIAEQLAKIVHNAIYISIPHTRNLAITFQSLIEQIRSQKSELFFNRPPETELTLTLSHLKQEQPNCLLIVDHLDRVTQKDLQALLAEIDSIPLPCILISRNSCPKKHFELRKSELIDWRASSFNSEEMEEFIEQCGVQNSLSSVLLERTNGNALKTRQMLLKLSGKASPFEGKRTKDSIKCITAIIACGGFLDEKLFCKIYELKTSTISSLMQFGLIRYTKEGCFPHDLLETLIEENKWPINLHSACSYWNAQVLETPFNRFACRSLVLLVQLVDDCSPFKQALGQCLETLNEREYCSFLLDLAAIFQKYAWDELLLQASDYLVDHEEYHRSGMLLSHLVDSPNRATKYHAIKNAIRRHVWIGEYCDAIKLYDSISTKEHQFAMRNHIGIAHFFLGNLDTALSLFQQNMNERVIQDERELGIAKYMLGLIMTYRNDDIAKAKKLIESSILIFESTRFYHWIIAGLNGLGDLSYSLKEWPQALFYLQKALTIAKALQNKTFLIFTLKNIARVQLRLCGPMSEELSLTTQMLQSVLNEVLKAGHNWATMWAQNVLCTVYAHRNEPKKMEDLVNEVAQLTAHYDECHIFSLSNQGHFAALTHNHTRAKEYYRKAYLLCQKVHNPFARIEIRDDFLNCKLPLDLQEQLL